MITEIILINRQAELVEMDLDGEILKRHLAIPDYFTSGKSHKRSLRESLRQIRDYGQLEESFMLPGSSSLPGECLQSYMLSLLSTEKHEYVAVQQGTTDLEITKASTPKVLPSVKSISKGAQREKTVKSRKGQLLETTHNRVAFHIQSNDHFRQRIPSQKRLRHGGYYHLT